MKYTVVWKPSVFDQLTALWLRVTNRSAVTSAVDKIDKELARSPHAAGESREENTRILMHSPLSVVFEISDDDRTVTIMSLGYHEPRH